CLLQEVDIGEGLVVVVPLPNPATRAVVLMPVAVLAFAAVLDGNVVHQRLPLFSLPWGCPRSPRFRIGISFGASMPRWAASSQVLSTNIVMSLPTLIAWPVLSVVQ